jgi:hypothetical protein
VFIDGDDYKLSDRERQIIDAMFGSPVYNEMFEELVESAHERGPFARDRFYKAPFRPETFTENI